MRRAVMRVAAKPRDMELDILKGMGIIFVIIGHMGSPLYGGNSILAYVYTFHIPLFFVVMGYLAIKSPEMGFKEYAVKRAKALLIPYAIFFIFSFAWTGTVFAMSQGLPWFSFPFHWSDFFQAFFLSGGYLNSIPLNNFPLWFLPLAFAASIVFYWILKIKDRRIIIAVTVATALLTIPIQAIITGRPAWHINVLPAAVAFMLVGYLFRIFAANRTLRGNSYIGVALIIIGFGSSLLLGEGANIAHINTYLYFVSALISIYGYYMFAQESRNRYLAYIGRNSLYFFSLHALILIMLPSLRIDQIFISHGKDGIIVYAVQLLSVILLTTGLVAAYKFVSKEVMIGLRQLRAS